MYPDVAFRMELRWLLYAFHLFDLGQHLVQQARAVQQFERTSRIALGQHLRELITHAFLAHLVDLPRQLANALECLWLDLVTEARRESNSSQHPQLVFAEAPLRTPDRADDSLLQILAS